MYDAILAQLRHFARDLDSFGYVSCLLKSEGRSFHAYTPPLCQRLRTAVKQLHAARAPGLSEIVLLRHRGTASVECV